MIRSCIAHHFILATTEPRIETGTSLKCIERLRAVAAMGYWECLNIHMSAEHHVATEGTAEGGINVRFEAKPMERGLMVSPCRVLGGLTERGYTLRLRLKRIRILCEDIQRRKLQVGIAGVLQPLERVEQGDKVQVGLGMHQCVLGSGYWTWE